MWVKRGISLIPIRWFHLLGNTMFSVQIAIFSGDGTLSIICGGIEMGQGLNTKVAQVVAAKFGITMDMISVKPSQNNVANNNSVTGGSLGSDLTVSVSMRNYKIIDFGVQLKTQDHLEILILIP